VVGDVKERGPDRRLLKKKNVSLTNSEENFLNFGK